MVFDGKVLTSMPLTEKLSVTLTFECMTIKIPKVLSDLDLLTSISNFIFVPNCT